MTSAIAKLIGEMEKQTSELKLMAKGQAEQARELADVKGQVSDFKKQLDAAQTALRSAKEAISDLDTASRANFKVVKTFAKALTEGIN